MSSNDSAETQKYKVLVEWTMCAVVEVEAPSLEEAISIADLADKLPEDLGEYMDGSYRALSEPSYELNEDILHPDERPA